MPNSEHKLIEIMRNTISSHELIKKNDTIVLGVSGGADSVALLKALQCVQSDFNLTLIVCHVNHKIRPGDAENDQEFVRKLCEDNNIEFHVKEIDVEGFAKENGLGTEEAGRQIRYDFFKEIAGDSGKIATAHNKNDNAETVTMRFMRGTGLQGLAGIPYKRDNIIRPLLDVERSVIEDYLKSIEQDHITDKTNNQAIYTRNKIRLKLIPRIEQDYNPNFINTLTKNVNTYVEENDFILQHTDEAIEKYFEFDCDTISINPKLLDEHIAIVKRSILNYVKSKFNYDLSTKMLDSTIALFKSKHGDKISLGKRLVARVRNGEIIIFDKEQAAAKKDDTEIIVAMCYDSLMNVGNMKIKLSMVTENNVENTSMVFYLPAKKFCFDTLFRTRRNGDIVTIDPTMSKKLKKFFVDAKIQAQYKDNYWLLLHRGRVVWIPGLFGSRLDEKERSGNFFKFEVV